MSLTPTGVSVRDFYAGESAKIQRDFASSSNGRKATEDRARLMDRIIVELFQEHFTNSPGRVCLVALGGYGRRTLFPYSDIDLLVLKIGRASCRERV